MSDSANKQVAMHCLVGNFSWDLLLDGECPNHGASRTGGLCGPRGPEDQHGVPYLNCCSVPVGESCKATKGHRVRRHTRMQWYPSLRENLPIIIEEHKRRNPSKSRCRVVGHFNGRKPPSDTGMVLTRAIRAAERGEHWELCKLANSVLASVAGNDDTYAWRKRLYENADRLLVRNDNGWYVSPEEPT